MAAWLVENFVWIGLAMAVLVVGIKLAVVRLLRKLAAADAQSKAD